MGNSIHPHVPTCWSIQTAFGKINERQIRTRGVKRGRVPAVLLWRLRVGVGSIVQRGRHFGQPGSLEQVVFLFIGGSLEAFSLTSERKNN
jgi:hypothetical protein